MTYKEELKTARINYKARMKSAKACYKGEKATIKLDYKTRKALLREIYKVPTLMGRMTASYQRMRLQAYEKAGSKAEDLRYKISNPDGYEAEVLAKDIEKSLKKYDNKLKTSSGLSETDLQDLVGNKMALELMLAKQLGRNVAFQKDLLDRINKILPESSNELNEFFKDLVAPA